MSRRYRIFVKRDLDGFFGLAIDNLVQLLLIVNLCGLLCGMTGDDARFIYQYILPGAAVSLLIGNLFYAAQAHWVARREKRSDVTALPYGINTPSLLVYILFVMKPVYDRTGNPAAAWQMGLLACLGSGIIEFIGAFVAEKFRRNTPRAALLSTLAGIAITFIAMTFALQIWQRPLVAMVPMAIVFLVYFADVRFPLGLPGGFVAVVVGTVLAWGFNFVAPSLTEVQMNTAGVAEAWSVRGQYWPIFVGDQIWALLQSPRELLWLLSVVIPMGLFNVIGSLQNIESAEAGGDVFATGPSMAVNGLGTMAAAMFGSCFPTTIYIGHPGWKALGARAGYSTLNGLVMSLICVTGTVALINEVVPIEAGIAIVVWIGVVITAQAFQATPIRHAPAVAVGLFPAIAAWGATVMLGSFDQALFNTPAHIELAQSTSAPATAPTGLSQDVPPVPPLKVATAQDVLEHAPARLGTQVNGFLIHGLNIMERGYIFTCMIISAIAAFLVDRRFRAAALWSMTAAVGTGIGLMHAYQLKGNLIDYLFAFDQPGEGAFAYRAWPVATGYLLMAAVFGIIAYYYRDKHIARGDTAHDARMVPAQSNEEDVEKT